MDTDQADVGGLDLLNAERGNLPKQGLGGGSAETSPANPTAAPHCSRVLATCTGREWSSRKEDKQHFIDPRKWKR